MGDSSPPTAFFQALLTPQDAVLSDELNHASIIDGIRLCKAHKYRYRHLDMADLEAKLQEAQVGQGPGITEARTGLLPSSSASPPVNQDPNPNPLAPRLYSVVPCCLDFWHLMCGRAC